MTTDRAAKRLLKTDLSNFINSENFTKTTFEFAPKDKSITLRVSGALLEEVQVAAKKQGVSYQKLIRQAVEEFLKKKVA